MLFVSLGSAGISSVDDLFNNLNISLPSYDKEARGRWFTQGTIEMPSIQGLRELSAFIPTVLPVLLPSLSIILCFSHLSCLAPLERGRARVERKRTTEGEAAQIR